MIDFWKSLFGMYRVEVTSASPEACLLRMNKAGICAYQVHRRNALCIRFQIKRTDLPRLKEICKNHGDSLTLCGEIGAYWKIGKIIKRPVLLFGLAFVVALTIFLPTRVLFVKVEGNRIVPTNQILEAAHLYGIKFGISREGIRSEQIKNGLLSQLPQLKWAGVNTKGCVAVISVREGVEETDVLSNEVSSIVALRDGVIISCTSTRGNLLCKEGQVVKQGQVLISAYTDCGLTIQATRAEGEVYAQTVRDICMVKPLQCQVRRREGSQKKSYSILIGKKRINLWKGSGIWEASCGRMYQEYYFILPGGFQLPLALCSETVVPYEIENIAIPLEETENLLIAYAKSYLLEDMVAGTIQSGQTKIFQNGELAVLEGDFLCREMIGRMQTEQMGVYNGKTN